MREKVVLALMHDVGALSGSKKQEKIYFSTGM